MERTQSDDALEMVEQELNNMGHQHGDNDGEATTEDELLRDEPGNHEDDDIRDDLFNEDEDDGDHAEVISLRSQSRPVSLPGTPKSGASLRSSQESATSVNS